MRRQQLKQTGKHDCRVIKRGNLQIGIALHVADVNQPVKRIFNLGQSKQTQKFSKGQGFVIVVRQDIFVTHCKCNGAWCTGRASGYDRLSNRFARFLGATISG